MHRSSIEETRRSWSSRTKPCPCGSFRLLLPLLSQGQENAKSSVVDHYLLQKSKHQHLGKGRPLVCIQMCEKDGVYHFPTWETWQIYKRCTGNHFSDVYCCKCSVHLCLNKDRNCFAAYHKAKLRKSLKSVAVWKKEQNQLKCIHFNLKKIEFSVNYFIVQAL